MVFSTLSWRSITATFNGQLSFRNPLLVCLAFVSTVFTPVCHFVHMEGVCHTPWTDTPLGRHPWADTLLGRHPWADTPWADTPCPVHAGIHTPLSSACWDTHTHPCPVHAGIHPPTQCMLEYSQQVGTCLSVSRGVCLCTLWVHQLILTNVTVSKDSDFSVLMVVQHNIAAKYYKIGRSKLYWDI